MNTTTHAAQPYEGVRASKAPIPLAGFLAVQWVSVCVCTVLCAGRVYVRWRCFRRLLVEDWLMVFAWAALVCVAALGQVYLGDVYLFMAISDGEAVPGPDFPIEAHLALRGWGIAMLLSDLGLYAIKLSFLFFFKRLILPVTAYTVLWWSVLLITIACFAVNLGVYQYDCVFGPGIQNLVKCGTGSIASQTHIFFKLTCVVDVLSDTLIILFPVAILWNIHISLRKKFILSGIFLLVSFTIAVAVVRVSIFDGTYINGTQQTSMTWLWFWIYVELSVSLIISCQVSFRALFTHTRQKRNRIDDHLERQQQSPPRVQQTPSSPMGLGKRARRVHDTLLRSFKATESVVGMELPITESETLSSTLVTEASHDHASKGGFCFSETEDSSGSVPISKTWTESSSLEGGQPS